MSASRRLVRKPFSPQRNKGRVLRVFRVLQAARNILEINGLPVIRQLPKRWLPVIRLRSGVKEVKDYYGKPAAAFWTVQRELRTPEGTISIEFWKTSDARLFEGINLSSQEFFVASFDKGQQSASCVYNSHGQLIAFVNNGKWQKVQA